MGVGGEESGCGWGGRGEGGGVVVASRTRLHSAVTSFGLEEGIGPFTKNFSAPWIHRGHLLLGFFSTPRLRGLGGAAQPDRRAGGCSRHLVRRGV